MNLKYKDIFGKENKFFTYIPLHGHTTYSLGDAITRLPDLVNKVKEIIGHATHAKIPAPVPIKRSEIRAGIFFRRFGLAFTY